MLLQAFNRLASPLSTAAVVAGPEMTVLRAIVCFHLLAGRSVPQDMLPTTATDAAAAAC
jgi:hypothetical protein